jgi:hypothetical protein
MPYLTIGTSTPPTQMLRISIFWGEVVARLKNCPKINKKLIFPLQNNHFLRSYEPLQKMSFSFIDQQ